VSRGKAVSQPEVVLPASRSAQPADAKSGAAARERILRAALDEFARSGFDGTTTRNIAKIAGVTPPLVLYHFESKEKLWLAAVSGALEGYLRFVHDEVGNDPNESAKTALTKFIRHFVHFSVQYPQIHRIMTTQEQDSQRLQWLVNGYIREYFNKIRDVIKRGQLEGTVRDGDPARIFYQIIGSGTLFSIPMEYKLLTGKDIASESEIHYTMAFIFDLIFT
jgi:AcrR family transcriptional regulator